LPQKKPVNRALQGARTAKIFFIKHQKQESYPQKTACNHAGEAVGLKVANLSDVVLNLRLTC